MRLRAGSDGHVPSGRVPRGVAHQHERCASGADIREHRPFVHALQRVCNGSGGFDRVGLYADGLCHGYHHPGALLRPSKLLARHRHYDGHEQLGQSSSVLFLTAFVLVTELIL